MERINCRTIFTSIINTFLHIICASMYIHYYFFFHLLYYRFADKYIFIHTSVSQNSQFVFILTDLFYGLMFHLRIVTWCYFCYISLKTNSVKLSKGPYCTLLIKYIFFQYVNKIKKFIVDCMQIYTMENYALRIKYKDIESKNVS